MKNMKVVVLDPALENVNAGDEIISESVQNIPGLGIAEVRRMTTHRLLSRSERQEISAANYVVLSGTNALSSHMERFRQWPIDPDLARRMRNKLILLGVGWWQYQAEPCRYTRSLLRLVLTTAMPHAVRDQYTYERITNLGIPALMTGCPTMWSLGRNQTPLGSQSSAVVTVTDYKRAPQTDTAWLDVVASQYDDVRLVGMGPGDEEYANSLNLPRNCILSGFGTGALNASLEGADFIGTRLHAGIRAMQLGKAALILGVDNRATEIARSTNLKVVAREDLDGLVGHLNTRENSLLRIPEASIARWQADFDALLNS